MKTNNKLLNTYWKKIHIIDKDISFETYTHIFEKFKDVYTIEGKIIEEDKTYWVVRTLIKTEKFVIPTKTIVPDEYILDFCAEKSSKKEFEKVLKEGVILK